MDMEEFTIAFLFIPWLRLIDLYRALASQVFHLSKSIRPNLYFHSLTVFTNSDSKSSRAPSTQVNVATKTKSAYQCHVCHAGPFQWEPMKLHATSTHYIASKGRRNNGAFLLVHIKQNLLISGKQLKARAGLRKFERKGHQRQSLHINATFVKQDLSSGKQWSRTLHPHIKKHPKIWSRNNGAFLLVPIPHNQR